MRKLYFQQSFALLLLLCLAACQQRDSKTVTVPKDSATTTNNTPPKDSAAVKGEVQKPLSAKDSSLVQLAEKVLTTLKNKNYKTLATYAHPDSGIFFSAFAYVRKSDSSRLSVAELNDPATPLRKVDWGAFELGDASTGLSLNRYFDKHVYDVDFLHAPLKSVNQFHNNGTDINNITEAFPNTD